MVDVGGVRSRSRTHAACRRAVTRETPRCGVAWWSAVGAFATLAALVWHARGETAWERPISALLRRDGLPLERLLVVWWQPVPFALLTLALAAAGARSGRVRLAVSGATGCFAAAISAELVLKPLVGRHRVHAGFAMFPSGHVTAAAACATFAWLLLGRSSPIRWVVVLVPALVAWAVVSERLHYPADAAAGMLLGVVVVHGIVRCAGLQRAGLPARPAAPAGVVVLPDDEVDLVAVPAGHSSIGAMPSALPAAGELPTAVIR